MRSFGIRILIALLVFCFAFPCFTVNAENETVEITLSFNGEAYKGSTLNLRVSVKKPTVALAGLEFTLAYDSKYVIPHLTENSDENNEMDSLIEAKPKLWEQMSNHKEGLYTFRFVMPDNGSDLLDQEGELVLSIPFSVQEAGTFEFEIASNDIIAVANDAESSVLTGIGNSLSVVAASEGQKIAVDLKGGDTAAESTSYLLEVEATNLGDTSGIVALEFDVIYDKTVFAPTVITNQNEEMNVFMKEMPGDWEQMCSFDESKGRYTLRFAAQTAELQNSPDALKSGKKMVIAIPFKVIGDEGDIASFVVESSSVIGLNCANGILSGNGSVKSVSIEKAPTSVLPNDLGYTVKDGFLLYVSEKAAVSDFLKPFSSSFSVNSKNEFISTGDVLTDGNSINLTVIVLGDINGSGSIDSHDYVFTKRYCMSTYKLNDMQMLAADIDKNGNINSRDYVFIKRHCLKTYTIKAGNQQ